MLNKLYILLIFTLGIYGYIITGKLQDTRDQLNTTENNLAYYESLTSTSNKQNRVLQLTINQLQTANDSLLNKLDQTRKELNIKDNEIKSGAYIKTVIKDSIHTVVKDKDFKKLLQLNPLTLITVEKTDSLLNVKLDLQNEQYLYVRRKKVYKNTYKNGWQRFWHFDWKKREISEYTIYNTNPLIKVNETRVVEL